MKYKEFKNWFNEMSCYCFLNLDQTLFCIDVIKYIDSYWFWQREKVWKEEYEFLTYINVIKPVEDELKNIRWVSNNEENRHFK